MFWWKALAGLAVVAGVFFGVVHVLRSAEDRGYQSGWTAREARAQAADLAVQRAVHGRDELAAQLVARTDAAHQAAAERIRVVYRDLRSEIPAHVTPDIDARFPLPVGFVRMHDAAALGVPTGQVPDPAGRADGDPSEVTASEAAGVLVDNYAACSVARRQLIDLQEFTRGLAGLGQPAR